MTGDPIDATQSKPSSSSSEVPFTAQESNVDSDSRLDTHPRYQARVEDEFDVSFFGSKSRHDGRKAMLYSAPGSPSESSDPACSSDLLEEQLGTERDRRSYGPFRPVQGVDLPHQSKGTLSASSGKSEPAVIREEQERTYGRTGPMASSSDSKKHFRSDHDSDVVSTK